MRSKRVKRPPITAPSEQARIMARAFIDIQPPKHIVMNARDRIFFKSVIEEFAKAEWTDHTLEVAALLARAMCDLEKEQNLLRGEGGIFKTDKNYKYINPRKVLMETHASMVLSLRRSLSLNARAQTSTKASLANKNKATKAIENMARAVESDLIPRHVN